MAVEDAGEAPRKPPHIFSIIVVVVLAATAGLLALPLHHALDVDIDLDLLPRGVSRAFWVAASLSSWVKSSLPVIGIAFLVEIADSIRWRQLSPAEREKAARRYLSAPVIRLGRGVR